MHWKTKSAAFRILSAIPFGGAIHHLLQRHVTREWPRPTPVIDQLIVAARDILAAASVDGDLDKARFLEIGAGRDLAAALAMRMLGVGSVTTLDIDRLARIDLINHAARHIAEQLGLAPPSFAEFEDLAEFGIIYRAPMRITDISDESFDCFYSIYTLEHIPPVPLAEVLTTSRMRLKPGGIAVHIIDYSDHYAREGGASRINFLRYSDRDWERHNSKFLYMNRLRHGQFLELFEKAGYRTIDADPFSLDVTEIPVSELDPKFQAMSVGDVAIIRARIAARA